MDGIRNDLREQFLDEWVKIPILQENANYVESSDDVTLFRGPIAKCAFKIAQVGFVPGPNGDAKNKSITSARSRRLRSHTYTDAVA